MALSTAQLLALNTLMYMSEAPFPQVLDFEGYTVRQLIDSFEPRLIQPDREYDCSITGREWLLLLDTIRQDPILLNMEIDATHIDQEEGGGGGHSAVLISQTHSEAVVVFKGTQSPEEWADNFAGVNLADTPQQRNALNWYRRIYRQLRLEDYHITVTGHSKGGNKAKYVSILDPSVDRCVSFDGQGFSELFIDKYSPLISQRQRVIESHSAEYDFVNFLFTNIGSAYFYVASPLENAGFGRNHSPSAMMHFIPGGGFRMVKAPHGQASGIQAISRFSDDFFRSITPKRRESSYQTVEAIRSAAFSLGDTSGSKDLINIFLPLASHPAYADDLAYLLAFTLKYTRCHPEFLEELKGLLADIGFEDFTKYIVLADGILNLNLETPLGLLTFDRILDDLGQGAQSISPGLLAIIIGWTISQGIELSPRQLRELLAILPKVHSYMDTIILEGGCPPRSSFTSSSNPEADQLSRVSKSLEFLGSILGGSTPGSEQSPSSSKLRRAGSHLRTIGQVTGQISSALQQIQPAGESSPDPSDVIDV